MNLIHGKQITPKISGLGLTLSNGVMSVVITDYFTFSNGLLQIDSSKFILQNGNTFGLTASIGTNDNYPLLLKTNDITALHIATNGYIGVNTIPNIGRFEVLNNDINTYDFVVRNFIGTVSMKANQGFNIDAGTSTGFGLNIYTNVSGSNGIFIKNSSSGVNAGSQILISNNRGFVYQMYVGGTNSVYGSETVFLEILVMAN